MRLGFTGELQRRSSVHCLDFFKVKNASFYIFFSLPLFKGREGKGEIESICSDKTCHSKASCLVTLI
jgi:hypothetical protein